MLPDSHFVVVKMMTAFLILADFAAVRWLEDLCCLSPIEDLPFRRPSPRKVRPNAAHFPNLDRTVKRMFAFQKWDMKNKCLMLISP
jgi:hypothetical protein